MAITSTKLAYWPGRFTNHHPITADIFLTDYCNNRCSYCRYGHESGGYMKFGDFTQYATALWNMGVRGFILTGGGEPTINPDFDLITKWLEQHNYDYGINTNFVRYSECSPRYLKISIDAGDAECYAKARGVDKFDTVVENVKRYLDFKAKTHSDTRVIVQCLAQSREQAERFFGFFMGMDVDLIQFRPFEGQNPVEMTEDYVGMVDFITQAARADKRVGKSFKFDMMGRRFAECHAQWSVMCVRHDGQVLYCCHRPDAIVGHVLDPDILLKKEQYRVDMSRCDVPCRLSGANAYVEDFRGETDINFV